MLYVNRLLQPLHHVVAAGDERDEEMVDACIEAILALEPRLPFDTSGRQVIAALREAAKEKGRKGFREATVRSAWKRITGLQDGDEP